MAASYRLNAPLLLFRHLMVNLDNFLITHQNAPRPCDVFLHHHFTTWYWQYPSLLAIFRFQIPIWIYNIALNHFFLCSLSSFLIQHSYYSDVNTAIVFFIYNQFRSISKVVFKSRKILNVFYTVFTKSILMNIEKVSLINIVNLLFLFWNLTRLKIEKVSTY